ncbi:hypothetical protein B0H34DRAFT_654685 [Crassisporium funariophilum]|nr:hypothetical protein B0H34DRAFT_654685 [Crassisporium funariophilum]
MGSCRICIDELKNPVSLPCGHIFCGDCITKALQAVQPTSNIHSCPICRSSYNIATPSLDVFPPYLRSFVAPSIRKVFINNSPSPSATADKGAPEQPTASTSSLSEITRLQAENHALRTNCAMWRRRAEMHGAANLGLLNFARAVRDQASHLARERDELRIYCSSLKRKLDDDELSCRHC